MRNLEAFKEQLRLKLEKDLDFPVEVEVGGKDWVVNVTPAGALHPPRIKKLIGIKPQENGILISVARSYFSHCGLLKRESFFGTGFSEKGSYMMLEVKRPLDPADVAPVIAEWLRTYVRNARR